MTMRISRRQALAGGSALLGAAAFGLGGSRTALAARNQAVLRVNRDIQNLDPANRIGPLEDNIVLATNQGLAKFRPGSLDWELDAAAELVQADDTVIEFTLKPGLMFHGGHGEMTTEDVKFSFERFQTAGPDGGKAAYADDWAALDHVEIIDKYKGRLHLKQASPGLWVVTICDGSGYILSRKAVEALGAKMATQIIGTGPYMQHEWKPNERFVLRRNPDWKGTAPHFDEIVLRPVVESKTAELAFRADEVHFTLLDDPRTAKGFEGDANTRIIKLPAIDYVWLGANMERPPLDDLKVRQAIRLAVDVDSVLLAAYEGTVPRAYGLQGPGVLGHWKDAPKYAHDSAAAKALLAEAGHPDGFKTRITLLNLATYEAAALVIQANLAEVGIDAQIDRLDPGAYWGLGEADKSKDLDLVIVDYSGKFDPNFQSQWFTSDQVGLWNWQRFRNAEFDKLHAESNATTDQAKREAMHIQMQNLMDESAAFVWLTHNANVFVAKTWLEPGLLPNGNNWQLANFKEV